jgi:hypothetical protein
MRDDTPVVCDVCEYQTATHGCEACGLLACATCQMRVDGLSRDPNEEAAACEATGNLHQWGVVKVE